jgi:hypothetical protein
MFAELLVLFRKKNHDFLCNSKLRSVVRPALSGKTESQGLLCAGALGIRIGLIH